MSLDDAEFIDSSIVRVLFSGDRVVLKQSRRLVVHSSARSSVDHVLEIAGIFRQLLCSESTDEAIEFASQCYQSSA